MGKPAVSCFKIISCGSDSVDHDDLQTPENKGSSDRRGWSFRKRSPRHRVLSNSVIAQTPASASKETPEPNAVNFQVQPDVTVPEKSPVIQSTEEKAVLSTHLDSKLSDTQASREEAIRAESANATHDESSIIVIQAAIRGLLAHQALLKQKSIVKLQAAVRGHIVRRHAIGTLRCVQAIIKMQALVRARQARLLAGGSADLAKQKESRGLSKKEVQSGTYTYVSIEKLLSNAFARQLMEATPRTEPINIKCDPLKSDSAWKWLERWMSISTVSNEEVSDEESQESEAAVEEHYEDLGQKHSDPKQDINLVGHSNCKEEDIFVQMISNSTDSESAVNKSVEAPDDDNLTSYDEEVLNLHSSEPTSPLFSHSEQHNNGHSHSLCDLTEPGPTEVKETNLVEVVEVTNLPLKEETGNNQDVPDLKMSSAEQPETEMKNISRKASNPAFIAAHSKFEELSSAVASSKVTISSNNEPEVVSSLESLDKVSSSTDQPFSSKDTRVADNAISDALEIQRGGSECGTEISISSTLDSPDRSEAGGNESKMEIKASAETDNPRTTENSELEAKSIVLEADPFYVNTKKLERPGSVESLNSANPEDLPRLKKKPEPDQSHLVNKSSPEGSPRSRVTVPESQATPSSQVSVKQKKSKGDKSGSGRKNRPSSAGKKLSNQNQDSASRSSLEQLQEPKSGKRRNSFGAAKPDHREQEPRDSSSSIYVPSYMQATESARAKAIASGSPRSSPDVHDKDLFIKKRHSLPGMNERQGSPRIHRSLSQAQQNVKGNASNSPQDRKWRR